MNGLVIHVWDEIRHRSCEDESEEGFTEFIKEPETNKLIGIECLSCGKKWYILNPTEMRPTGDEDE